MEGAKVGITIAPQDAQCRCDGAPTRRQDDAGDQDQDVRPGRTGEQIGEAREPGHKLPGSGEPDELGRSRSVASHGTIGVLNRGNLPADKSITILSSPRPSTTVPGMTKPDPTLARIAAQFTRHSVKRAAALI